MRNSKLPYAELKTLLCGTRKNPMRNSVTPYAEFKNPVGNSKKTYGELKNPYGEQDIPYGELKNTVMGIQNPPMRN
jgi:hypothetical protein